jgi:ERCC4-type nuclease
MLRLQKASIEDLKKVPGVGAVFAELIYHSLHPEQYDPTTKP